MAIRVVFTGKLSQNRAEMEAHAASRGFLVLHKVEAGTDYLVVGKRPGKTKLRDAQRFGTRQITEGEYEVLGHTKGAGMNAAPATKTTVRPPDTAPRAARPRKKALAIEKRPAWLEGVRKRPASVQF